tara:strand:- start:987 stop:1322 length:336 start_codon:yes stop_codon:yes gene_type:complete
MGYEDEKRWKENQEKLKKKREILQNGGKIELPKQSTRDNQDKKVIVHLVPHSHDDAGWLKTVDEYYYGTSNKQQHVSTKNILDTVIHELALNESRKFTYVEMVYFTKWYNL